MVYEIEKMDDIQDSTEATGPEHGMGDQRKETCQSEVRHLLEKLSSWREESNRQFSNIIDSHTQNINKGVNDLAEEVCDLRTKLAIITKERNDLLENVGKLSGENRQLKAVIHIVQPLPDREESNCHGVGRQDNQTQTRICRENEDLENADSIEEQESKNQWHNQKNFIGSFCSVDDIEIKHEASLDEEEIDQFDGVQHVSGGESETLKCQECAQSYESSRDLGRHLKAVHKQVCEECGYATKEKATLRQHREAVHGKMRRVHKKRHVCNICITSFYHKSSLMRHNERVHQMEEKDDNDDKCPSCDFRGKVGAVRQHYSRLHKRKDKKTYVEAKRERNPSLFPSSCKECGMKFANRRNLINHVKNMHPELEMSEPLNQETRDRKTTLIPPSLS